MRNKRLQNQVTAGRFTLPAVTLICTLCWVSTSFLFPQLASIPTQDNQPFFWQSIQSFLLPGWAEQIVSFLIYAIIGYFLIELNNQFGIIRMRASMQTAIYFLLAICGRYCRFGFSDIHLFPVQKLPAITRGGLPFLFLPLYRNGKYHFSPTNCFFGTLDT